MGLDLARLLVGLGGGARPGKTLSGARGWGWGVGLDLARLLVGLGGGARPGKTVSGARGWG